MLHCESRDLATTSDCLNPTTTRAYDAVSRPTTQTDPLGRLTWYTYDGLNRLTTLPDPLQRLTIFSYEANGNSLTVRDTKGQTTANGYDAASRVTQVDDMADPHPPTTREYDLRGYGEAGEISRERTWETTAESMFEMWSGLA